MTIETLMTIDNNVLVDPADYQIGDSGYIRSPNYPSAYPADIKCVWWLKAKSKGSQYLDLIFSQAFFILLTVLLSGRISMTCTDVRTQSCDAGYFDYILVILYLVFGLIRAFG